MYRSRTHSPVLRLILASPFLAATTYAAARLTAVLVGQ